MRRMDSSGFGTGGYHGHSGFSLIELMVAMVVGLIILGVIGALFLNSRQTYLAQDANSRLQENARYVTELLSRQIRMAGYARADFSIISSSDPWAKAPSLGFSGTAITGSDGGDSASDSITLSFDADKDCLGNAVTTATNLFRVNGSSQLECTSAGKTAAILDDVESMQLLYRQSGSSAYEVADSGKMASVNSVRICLVLRAKADAKNKAVESDLTQSYVDCSGDTKSSSDGYLRRAVTMTVALRNRMP